MTPARLTREAKFALVVALLLASISASRLIPFGPFLGLDFQNLWAFHHCDARNDPYLATGRDCGDVTGRDMFYPPLLYWSYAWVRPLTFDVSMKLWAAFVGLGVFGSLLFWIRRAEWAATGEKRLSLFLLLLLVQFPALFAMERGNNDVLVVIGWTLSLHLYLSGRKTASGFVAGLATAMKLYPLFALLVLFVGLCAVALRAPASRKEAIRFAAAYAGAGALTFAIFFADTVAYLTDELPRFSGRVGELALYSHNLRALKPESAFIGWALALPILAAWCLASTRLLARDPVLIFAGALAISTSFANTSYDYNLITAFPLLLVLFIRTLQRSGNPFAFGLLMLGLVAVIGDRALFAESSNGLKLRIVLQCLWLAASGLLAGKVAEDQATVPGAEPARPAS